MVMKFSFGSSAWELSLGCYRLGSFAWETLLGISRLGTPACDISLETFVWSQSFGIRVSPAFYVVLQLLVLARL